MIRVMARHVYAKDGTFLGDFQPSEIPALLESLQTAKVYLGDEGPYVPFDGAGEWLQYVEVAHNGTRRLVLEVLFE
jgi:hypothetical protein